MSFKEGLTQAKKQHEAACFSCRNTRDAASEEEI